MKRAALQLGGEALCLPVDQVRPESVLPVPRVDAVLRADEQGLGVRFHVYGEKGFRLQKRGFQGPVHLDSCVEIFLRPPGETAYLNVECNAGGDLHASWIRDPARRAEGGFRDYRLLREEEAKHIHITPPEKIQEGQTLNWELNISIAWALFPHLTEFPGAVGTWGMNLYKCADESTFPHWLSWSPCSEKNFHAPHEFGRMDLQT